MWIKLISWAAVSILFFTYLGYSLLLFLFSLLKNKKKAASSLSQPTISIIIASYNEGKIIEEKLRNTLLLQYPQDRLQIIAVADGSTDATIQLASAFENANVLFEKERKGKSAAINRAVSFSSNDILVSTDANTLLKANCLEELIHPFQDEMAGAVASKKRVMSEKTSVHSGEGLYWKYES